MAAPDLVQAILTSHGPMLSSVLATHLQDSYRLSAAAARQQISRNKTIRRLSGLPFPRNARFVYLQEQYGREEFWESLTAALEAHAPAYARALHAISTREKVVPSRLFPIVCGAPLARKGHLSPDSIRQRLLDAKLIFEYDLPSLGKVLTLHKQQGLVDLHQSYLWARQLAEEVLLDAIKDWSRQLALGSYDKHQSRDQDILPQVSSFCWDLSAPSYLNGLRRWHSAGKPNPGFLVCDLLLYRDVSIKDISAFMHKVRSINCTRSGPGLFPIFVAEGYNQEALHQLRSIGALPLTPSILFGKSAAAALRELIQVLTELANTCQVEPLKLQRLFTKLGKMEGSTLRLQGALFEYLVADILRQTIPNVQIKMNVRYRSAGKDLVEVDVEATNQRLGTFVECKAHRGDTPHEEIIHWYEHTRHIRKQAQDNLAIKDLTWRFEFWSTGQITEKSREFMATIKSTNKYSFALIGPTEISEQVQNGQVDHTLRTLLQQHYLRHPLLIEMQQPLASPPSGLPFFKPD